MDLDLESIFIFGGFGFGLGFVLTFLIYFNPNQYNNPNPYNFQKF
jgi:hypothetical protein